MNIVLRILPAATLLLAACAMTPSQPTNKARPTEVPSTYTGSGDAAPGPQGSAMPPKSSATSTGNAPAAAPPIEHVSAASTVAAPVTAPAAIPPVTHNAQATEPAKVAESKSSRTGSVTHLSRNRKHVAAAVMASPRATRPRVAGRVDLSGRVELNAGRGQHLATGDLAHTLVYFVPESGNVVPRPGRFTVFTQDREYDPGAMAIPLGSTITFVNLDDVRHNEFSVTPGSAFNLGYQSPGEKTPHVFSQPGLVLVGCLVHRQMELDVLVVPTVYVARASADGRFILRGLPAGPGTLHFWNPRARPALLSVTLPLGHAIEQRLTAIKSPLAVQLNVDAQP